MYRKCHICGGSVKKDFLDKVVFGISISNAGAPQNVEALQCQAGKFLCKCLGWSTRY